MKSRTTEEINLQNAHMLISMDANDLIMSIYQRLMQDQGPASANAHFNILEGARIEVDELMEHARAIIASDHRARGLSEVNNKTSTSGDTSQEFSLSC